MKRLDHEFKRSDNNGRSSGRHLDQYACFMAAVVVRDFRCAHRHRVNHEHHLLGPSPIVPQFIADFTRAISSVSHHSNEKVLLP